MKIIVHSKWVDKDTVLSKRFFISIFKLNSIWFSHTHTYIVYQPDIINTTSDFSLTLPIMTVELT